MPAYEISPELDALSCELIGAAIGQLEETGALPVLLAVDCEDDFFAFEDDTPDGCYRAACQQVADLGAACTRYALVYDGVVQEDDTDPGSPAIILEFAERAMEHAWSGYLLYRFAADGVVEVSDPFPAGMEELLFA